MTRSYVSLLAYVALTAALLQTPETYDLVGVGLVLAALLLSAASSLLPDAASERPRSGRLLPAALGLFILGELAFVYASPVSELRPDDPLPVGARVTVVLLGCGVLSYAWKGMPGGRWRFPAVLAVFLAGAFLIGRTWDEPGIDVWHLQTGACRFLARGQDPYAQEYPNIYPDEQFFGKEQLHDGNIRSFPYPPLSLLLSFPGYLAGDVRWSTLAATAGAAVCMVAAGRRLGLPPGHPAELAPVAFLCHPRTRLVLEMAWTEPFVALAVALCAWGLAGQRGYRAGLALGAAVTVKQFGVLWLPSAWMTGRLTVRNVAFGAAVAGLVVLPFLVWNPSAFWLGVVGFHVHSPFREDSLSVPAAVFGLTHGYQLPAALGFVAAAAVLWLVLRHPRAGVSAAALSAAAVFLAFFVFNKAAHQNYYWLACALLALATITSAAESSPGPDLPRRA